jgi:hypothetical protein
VSILCQVFILCWYIMTNIKCSAVLVLKHLQRTAMHLFNVTQLPFVFCIHCHQKPLNFPLRNETLPNYNTKMVSLIIILVFNFGSEIITNVPNFPNSVFHYQRHIRWHWQLNLKEKQIDTIMYFPNTKNAINESINKCCLNYKSSKWQVIHITKQVKPSVGWENGNNLNYPAVKWTVI